MSPVVAGVEDAGEPVHESGLGNGIQLPGGVFVDAHAVVYLGKNVMVWATAYAGDDLDFDGLGGQYEAAFMQLLV
jgi:hypothetical protein